MKARVKAKEKVIDEMSLYIYDQKEGVEYDLSDLEIIGADPDYWTRLEHQAAIAAMLGMCANPQDYNKSWDEMADHAANAAHALVEKYKKEDLK